MQSNVARTRRTIAQRDDVKQVAVDGDQTEAILRVLADEDKYGDDLDELIESDLGCDIQNKQYVGVGVEVEVI
jgi:hypothetical protein